MRCVTGWGGDPGGWAGTAGRSSRGGVLRRVARGGATRPRDGCGAAGRGGLAASTGACRGVRAWCRVVRGGTTWGRRAARKPMVRVAAGSDASTLPRGLGENTGNEVCGSW